MPTDDRPLRDVLREVEACFAAVDAGVGPCWRHNELLALVTKSCAPRLARELRALAPLLREAAGVVFRHPEHDGLRKALCAKADELESR